MEESYMYACPCCGFLTLSQKAGGTFEICPVCYWEDDNVQLDDPDFSGGANVLSLNQSKKNFAVYGAIEKRFLDVVRAPLPVKERGQVLLFVVILLEGVHGKANQTSISRGTLSCDWAR